MRKEETRASPQRRRKLPLRDTQHATRVNRESRQQTSVRGGDRSAAPNRRESGWSAVRGDATGVPLARYALLVVCQL